SYIEKNNLYIGIYRLRVEYNNDLKITHDLLEDKEEIDANLLKMESTDSDYLEYKTTVRSQYVTTTYPFALYYDSKNRIKEFYIEKNNLYIGIYRLRVEYNNDLKITHDLLEDKEEIDANLLKMESTDSDYLEYKTTVRSQYVTTTYPFALYYDSKNRITEFNI